METPSHARLDPPGLLRRPAVARPTGATVARGKSCGNWTNWRPSG